MRQMLWYRFDFRPQLSSSVLPQNFFDLIPKSGLKSLLQFKKWGAINECAKQS
jgi:hypothetical protein